MNLLSRRFQQVWLCDFEFHVCFGGNPRPICLVAREWRTGRVIRIWEDELAHLSSPPFPIDDSTLFVAYYASAEIGCFLSLGWPLPCRILDLYAEFSCEMSGLLPENGRGLIGALIHHGLPYLAATEKEDLQHLVMQGGPWTEAEQLAILDYCQSDVDALNSLLSAMLPKIDLPRALLRGRYVTAVARMERNGIPIDLPYFDRFRERWNEVRAGLIARFDRDYCVYDGQTFKVDRFKALLTANRIPWPVLKSGKLSLEDDTFREMARCYPVIAPLRELRTSLSQLRLNELAIGPDGRNRCLLSPFRSKTGRNQPSNSKFIFGPSAWLRSLIRPEPGRALAYIDWSQQEAAIAAALSGDPRMKEAYLSGDFYLNAAKSAGVIPANGTNVTHKKERDQFKVVTLGTQYGMSEKGIATKLGISEVHARELLRRHRTTFPVYWRWSEAVCDTAMLRGSYATVFGWKVHATRDFNTRSFRNFPMQANGAEMMRLACSILTENSVSVCCPVHDALLVEGPTKEIEQVVDATQSAMRRAGEIVLNGFPLRSDKKVVRYPERYRDERGAVMWSAVCELVGLKP